MPRTTPSTEYLAFTREAATKPKRKYASITKDADQTSLDKLRNVDIEAYHRERRRRNQDRYRRRQRQQTTDLENDTRQLCEEIARLKHHRYNLSRSFAAKPTMWSVAAKYFCIFRRGLLAPQGDCIAELDLLRTMMAPDMDAGTVRGFDALVRNWRVFTELFQDVQVQVQCMEQVAENLLVATTTIGITISRISLHNMFPHLKHKRLSPIGEKLLGQRLVLRGSVRFGWDTNYHCVASLISQSDMVTPMLQLLGNLEDVSVVFSGALIQPDGNLLIGEHLERYTACY